MLRIIFLRVDTDDWFSKQVYWWNKLIAGRPPDVIHCGIYDGLYFYHSSLGGIVQEAMTDKIFSRIVYQFVLPEKYECAIRALGAADYRIYWWKDIPMWVFKKKSTSCVTFCRAILGYQNLKFYTPDEFMNELKELVDN